MGEASPLLLSLLKEQALDGLGPAISPWRYTPYERWKWEQGMNRIREGEHRMKAEREKREQG